MNLTTPQKKIKENRYIQAIFAYGVVPVLLLLEEYEDNENFEECQIILESITFINTNLEGEKLPLKYDATTLSKLREWFSLYGFSGDSAIENMPYYMKKIKDLVKLPIEK
jgi:hypothetical protein